MSPWFIILSVISVALQPSFCLSPEKPLNAAVCNTQSCRDVGTTFLTSMDATVQPCDNFYNFACGSWKKNYPAPYHIRGQWNNLLKLSLLTQTRLKVELESPPTSSDSQPVKLMKKFYKSCIDQRANERNAVDRILATLHKTGGWPMVMGADQWNQSGISWRSLDEFYFNIRGESAFYRINLTPVSSSKLYTLTIQNSRLMSDFTNDRKTYKNLVQKVAEAAMFKTDVNVPSNQLNADINELMYLENQLQVAYKDFAGPGEMATVANDFIQYFKTLTKNNPRSRIDLEKIFQKIFVITNVRPSKTSPIILKTINYFVELARILQATSKRTIVNYINWKFLVDILPHATEEMEGLFHKILYNVEDAYAKDPRWVYCVNKIGRNYASYSLFIKNYYQENSRQKANSLYGEILSQWVEQIDNSNWLSRGAKDGVKAKINSLSAILGYSTFYDNDQKIMKYFEGLEMSDNYFTNNLNYEYHMWKRQIQFWGKTVGSKETLDDPLSIRAHLHRGRNHFVVTPPFLQSPLLDGTLPDYVTYSTVGNVMGHEMSHALESNVFEPLLTGTEKQSYKDILRCFIDSFNLHFNRISSDNACRRGPSRGEITRSENMADWNGLQFAYQAYQKKKKSLLPTTELKLPGFEKYTSDQMFFISFAQTWCTADDKDHPSNVHAPEHIRVNGVVANTAEFATAFECKEHTPMNPTSKCNTWTKPEVK